MTKEKVTKASTLPINLGGRDHIDPPFYRTDEIINKAIVYRDEGNTASVHSTLDRYYWSKIGIAETRTQRYTISPCFQSANLLQLVTQTSPSPGISCIHTVPHAAKVTRITGSDSVNEHSKSSCKESTAYNALKDVHISERLMEDFLELARDNTSKDLETCGVLGASLKEGTFYVTTLIIPKQESTSNSCHTRNEVEIFAIQNEQSLYPVGWIHTHPSQSCFMSSIDLHTQYSYQVMVPEAVAIVMAPTDKSRGYGVFRLSEPVGMSILRDCQEGGYHPHREPADGSSIYEHCSNVYINPYLRLEICDLR